MRKYLPFVIMFAVPLLVLFPHVGFTQEEDPQDEAGVLFGDPQAATFPIAKTLSIADAEVAYGDIILFDPLTNHYRRSRNEDDPRIYGVVVETPAVLVQTDSTLVPVADSGEVYVNIVADSGDIKKGDPLTTSDTAGKGMRATEDHMHILGYALGDAEGFGEDMQVLISIKKSTVVLDAQSATEDGVSGVDGEQQKFALKFFFAAVVALGSIALVFITFISSARQGVISIGRNPLARGSIRSMVFLNVLLAIFVAIAGIFFAISLLTVPI